MSHKTKTFQTPTGTPTAKPRLLIVEDEVASAKIYARALKGQFDVKIAHDGIVASTMLQDHVFDIILTDIILPGISGIELLRLVRTYDLDVPVLLMTGAPELAGAIQAVELGAVGYLLKPFKVAELERRLTKAIALRRLARAKQEALEILPAISLRRGAAGSIDRAGLAILLDRAIADMHLVFQPIVDVDARAIVAYEALMRTSDPALGSPVDIIEAAERLRATGAVTRRVTDLAASAVGRLPESASLYVNIHARDLRDDDLFTRSPLLPHARRIVLEITERGAIDGIGGLVARVRSLRAAGYRLAIDDLGAGYAGLTTFATIEPEIVKIDMSLVRGIDASIVRQRIVGSVVRLSRELNMRVVAEGVETVRELAIVIDLGCDLVQGFYLGRPAPEFVATFQGW